MDAENREQARNQDRRVQRSKDRLMRTLCEALAERPLSEVTVSDLCERAHMSRATFYRHYRVPADILTEFFGTIFDENIKVTDTASAAVPADRATIYRVLYAFCSAYEAHREVFTAISLPELAGVVRGTLPQIMPAQGARGGLAEHGVYSFVAGGVVTVVMQWMADGFVEPVEQVAALLADSIARCLDAA